MTKCLRCGECCYVFVVRIPKPTPTSGEPGATEVIKPDFELCPYYSVRDGKGHCSLHGGPSYPRECADFVLPSPSGTCALGEAIWAVRGRPRSRT